MGTPVNRYRAWFVSEKSIVSPEPADIIYKNKPNGNLVGDLPAGARAQNDSGTLCRKDGGDPFERAIFTTPSGRTIIVERQE